MSPLTLLRLPEFRELARPAARWRKHKRALARLGIQHASNVLDTALLRHSVVGVLELLALQSVFDPLHHGLVAVPVVDDGVALGGIDHALDVILRLTGNADQGVDVGAYCEL